MRSLLNKKRERGAAGALPWHPDFRNHQRLPDIKVIRTAFFINGASISVFIALLSYLGMQEWQVWGLNKQIAESQRKIDRDKIASDQATTLYKRFQVEEARILEVSVFTKSKPLVSELLLHLGATLPKHVALDGFDMKTSGLGLRGTVHGASDQATGYVSAYIEQLKSDPAIAVRFDDVALTSLTRDSNNNRVVIDLFLKLKILSAKGEKVL